VLASEVTLEIMALTTVVLCVFGTALGCAMLARAWRRLRLYRTGARRAYAWQQLIITAGRLVQVILFLATGLVLSLMDESDLRSGIARLLVLGVVLILVFIQAFDPISQSRIEYLRAQEKEREAEKEES
jgi:uncharacterized iron-regulated membrane protein